MDCREHNRKGDCRVDYSLASPHLRGSLEEGVASSMDGTTQRAQGLHSINAGTDKVASGRKRKQRKKRRRRRSNSVSLPSRLLELSIVAAGACYCGRKATWNRCIVDALEAAACIIGGEGIVAAGSIGRG